MIDILNLLWIVPLSMIIGALSIICVACVINTGNITKEQEQGQDDESANTRNYILKKEM